MKQAHETLAAVTNESGGCVHETLQNLLGQTSMLQGKLLCNLHSLKPPSVLKAICRLVMMPSAPSENGRASSATMTTSYEQLSRRQHTTVLCWRDQNQQHQNKAIGKQKVRGEGAGLPHPHRVEAAGSGAPVLPAVDSYRESASVGLAVQVGLAFASTKCFHAPLTPHEPNALFSMLSQTQLKAKLGI
eukprot:6174010-Pleurochrysis_carterae.AAC.2